MLRNEPKSSVLDVHEFGERLDVPYMPDWPISFVVFDAIRQSNCDERGKCATPASRLDEANRDERVRVLRNEGQSSVLDVHD